MSRASDETMREARRRFLLASGWFDAEWYAATAGLGLDDDPLEHWLDHGASRGVGPNETLHALGRPMEPCGAGGGAEVAKAAKVAVRPREWVTDDAVLYAEMDLLRTSGLFDEDYYLEQHPDVRGSRYSPVSHFCHRGWLELRRPNPSFDVWWYWANHLDPGRYAINPLVHYALMGELAGLSGLPASTRARPGASLPLDRPVKRVCLFAAYDRDGLVDEAVVDFVRELSRFADVYYLADCHVEPEELAKVSQYTKGAWGIRHGAYDFGSYSMLAEDLVGWDTIDDCDELLFVNDSCFLLRPLDDLFETMSTRQCDWWGLQATKGLFRTRSVESNRFGDKVPLEAVKSRLLDTFEQDALYDFHVGSYFMAFRPPVVRDARFRRQVDAVHDQSSKLLVIQKYEIGLTHYLVGNGFSFDTYIPDLYPFHPLFTASHFDLIERGFPLLKKYFLYQNHYDTPDLVRWKERVAELVPAAPVEMLERSLVRSAPADRLKRSFSIVTAEDGTVLVPRLLSSEELVEEDRWAPKHDHWWAFPVCAYEHTFSGNERAVFEEVRCDPTIKKIVLTLSRSVDVDGENVVVVPLESPEGQYHLLRSRQIFIKHSTRRNVRYALSETLHNYINLWHGIPLKRFGMASLDTVAVRTEMGREHARLRAVISSSRVDTLAMATSFAPVPYENVWLTGLPRNDMVVRPFNRLPQHIQAQEERLRAMLRGRRLVLFMPTFKNAQADGYYEFRPSELEWLEDWCQRNDAVIGVREHMADSARGYSRMLARIGSLSLGASLFPDPEVLYRVGSVLITDYSSCAVDFLLTGRPVISFAYDHDEYSTMERGLFYDLADVLPGPVCVDFDELSKALGEVFVPVDDEARRTYEARRSLFFDHIDDENAWRVVQRVKQLYTFGR